MIFDELVHQPDQFFQELFTFIGVDSTFKPVMESKHHKGKLKVNGVVRKYLKHLHSKQEIKNRFKI